MTAPKNLLLFLSFLLALCSLTYELVLAQILSATLGGTLLRHSTVIGLFTLSLGLGALSFGKSNRTKTQHLSTLFTIEVTLALMGLLSPFFVVFLEPFRLHYGIPFFFDTLYYIPVIAIGWLSGFELPLLLTLCKDRSSELQILAADYIGMFAGSLFVPLFLYPEFGPFVGSLWMSLLNLIGAAFILPFIKNQSSFRSRLFVISSLFVSTVVFLLSQSIWLEWIRRWFTSSL